MSLLFGALGGLGEAGLQIGAANQKAMLDQEADDRRNTAAMALEDRRSAATMEREKTLMRLKMDLETEAKNAPLNRLGAKAQSLIGEAIPVEPEPVTNLTGAGMNNGVAFKGDPKALLAQAESWPDNSTEKAGVIAQLKKQISADEAINAKAVEGQTRTRTPNEALDSAVEWARANDLPAVAAYEAQIGRPAREDRRLDASEKRTDAQIANEKARTVVMDRRLDMQEAYQLRRDERADKYMEIQEARLTAQGDKAEMQSQRAAITNLMTSTERELERTSALAKDLTLSDAERAAFQSRVTSLQRDLGRYRKGLEGFGGDALSTTTEEKPQPKAEWNNATGEVRRDGQVIGKAKTAEEAKSLIANYTEQPRKTDPEPVKEKAIQAPESVKPAEAPARAKQPLIGEGPRNTIEQLEAGKMADIKPLADSYKQAESMFLTAAKSGDQGAIAKYMREKERIRAELESKVREQFGNNANNILKKLYE